MRTLLLIILFTGILLAVFCEQITCIATMITGMIFYLLSATLENQPVRKRLQHVFFIMLMCLLATIPFHITGNLHPGIFNAYSIYSHVNLRFFLLLALLVFFQSDVAFLLVNKIGLVNRPEYVQEPLTGTGQPWPRFLKNLVCVKNAEQDKLKEVESVHRAPKLREGAHCPLHSADGLCRKPVLSAEALQWRFYSHVAV
ncbi:MAG TPA: hypothetical protein VHM26_14765 [Chitinophagaceae bacterium]|jgi:hypothetical protein|nr:hypothetical protein [Chitinophagaceae bacterium]